MIRRRVMKTHQCALDIAGLSISTLIMFTDDCRSFQAATGIREKTAHTRHHQKLEKGKKKRKLPPGSLRVCGFLSINVVCIFGGAPPHYCSWGRPNRPGWAQYTLQDVTITTPVKHNVYYVRGTDINLTDFSGH